jgi:hypothetical protein
MTGAFPEELIVVEFVKQLPAVYRTRSFFSVLTRPPSEPVLRQTNPIHIIRPCVSRAIVIVMLLLRASISTLWCSALQDKFGKVIKLELGKSGHEWKYYYF